MPKNPEVLILTISLENDAFQEGNRRSEVARILRDVASQIETGREKITVMDVNGNTVGSITVQKTRR